MIKSEIKDLYNSVTIPFIQKIEHLMKPGLIDIFWTSINITNYFDTLSGEIKSLKNLVDKVYPLLIIYKYHALYLIIFGYIYNIILYDLISLNS